MSRRTKRRRQSTRDAADRGRLCEPDLLSKGLLASLGPEDASNRLVMTGSRKKRKEKCVGEVFVRDRKLEQVERKKEREVALQDVYAELQRHALSGDEWRQLQDACKKAKSKKRRETSPLPVTESETDSPTCPNTPIADPQSQAIHETKDLELCEKVITSPEPNLEETEAKKPEFVVTESPKHPHRVIGVIRTPEVEASRSELPIVGYEQEIMESVSLNDIVVICGQTGCGKTTQVPQFLYEAGYGCRAFPERCGMIGITQPRRIAATSTAARVAHELNAPVGTIVGFQIRHESRISPLTAVKFMTDGILIRELQSDFLLRQYSVLVIDEAHERSLNTDLILGMLSRIVKLRRQLEETPPLKVLIMSATLEAGAFLSNKHLFAIPPPVLEIPSRQFSVTVHFSKKTEADYEAAAMKKVCRIHRQLPPGAILVFLTGKREIDKFCSKITKRLTQTAQKTEPVTEECESEECEIDDYTSDEDVEILAGNADHEDGKDDRSVCQDVTVLPLYAMLPPQRQAHVFEPVPDGHRLIVVATNVAETSITIPGVRYVVDAGRAKKKVLHAETGVSHFQVDWISKASAIQRAGRAGRTLPGHCYRLYSSAHFGQRFAEYELPEISCVSLEDVVLLMKAMGIQKVTNFPFPSPPDASSLKAAEDTLVAIGALESDTRMVTELGQQMAELPIGPRHARMIFKAKEMEEKENITGLTLYALSLAAVMSLESPFLFEHGGSSTGRKKQAHRRFVCPVSDPISALNALCQYNQHPQPLVFCRAHLLHDKIMKETAALEKQLRRNFLQIFDTSGEAFLNASLPDPEAEMVDHLRRCIAAGWCDQISRRNISTEPVKKSKHVPYLSQQDAEELIFIHPLSALSKTSPQFVVYSNAMKTTKRVYMNAVTKIEPEWIFEAAQPLCTIHLLPVLSPGPFYDQKRDAVCCWHKVRYGRQDWELPLQSIPCEDPEICVPHFAFALLSGRIFADVNLDSDQLVMPAAYATSMEANFNKKLGLLLVKLKEAHVLTKTSLIQQLHNDAHFLFDELKLWIKSCFWPSFLELWNAVCRDR